MPVILIPKEPDTRNLKKYRSISLLNYSFKNFSKAMNVRVSEALGRWKRRRQTCCVLIDRIAGKALAVAYIGDVTPR
jgi:hypothetical protein